ncbi:hypothetical protein NCCP2648_14650 [Lacticaseibacillus rhamnosus]|nr:hypothetical protein NCCP2648_14650 [Lacticaseibacillus rhamnosus]
MWISADFNLEACDIRLNTIFKFVSAYKSNFQKFFHFTNNHVRLKPNDITKQALFKTAGMMKRG